MITLSINSTQEFRNYTWVLVGQLAVVLGQLIGIKILTTFLEPSSYGYLYLLIGIASLLSLLCAGPSSQAVATFLVQYIDIGKEDEFQAAVVMQVLSLFIVIAVTLLLLYTATDLVEINLIDIVCLLILALAEACKIFFSAYLVAKREYKNLAIWRIVEVFSRLTFIVFIFTAGIKNVAFVMLCFFIATFLSLLIINTRVQCLTLSIVSAGFKWERIGDIVMKVWRFTLPLIPLGFLGWVSSLSDRYIISYFLDNAQLGIYIAAYSLASQPFLFIGKLFQSIFRPKYQKHISQKDFLSAKRIIVEWALLLLVFGITMSILVTLLSEFIVEIVMGPLYSQSSEFFGWIAVGYTLLLFTHLAHAVSYSFGKTIYILHSDFLAAISSVIVTVIFVKSYGVMGAAYAIPVYFLIQTSISSLYSYLLLFKNKL